MDALQRWSKNTSPADVLAKVITAELPAPHARRVVGLSGLLVTYHTWRGAR